MWEHRNHAHTKDLSAQQRRDLRHLQNQVRQEFQKGKTSLDPPDRRLLKDQPTILTLEMEEMKSWLTTVASASRAAKETRRERASRKCMHRWLASAGQEGRLLRCAAQA